MTTQAVTSSTSARLCERRARHSQEDQSCRQDQRQSSCQRGMECISKGWNVWTASRSRSDCSTLCSDASASLVGHRSPYLFISLFFIVFKMTDSDLVTVEPSSRAATPSSSINAFPSFRRALSITEQSPDPSSLPPFLPSSLPPFLPSSLPPFLPSSLPPFLPSYQRRYQCTTANYPSE